MTRTRKLVIGAAATTAVVAGTTGGCLATSGGGPVTVSVPSTVAADCSSDVTAQLSSLLTSVPAGTPTQPTTIQLGTNACYRVNNLLVTNLNNVNVVGNGAKFKQNSYIGNNTQQPVVTIGGNTNVTVNGVNFVGPSSTGGSNNEGDIGLLLWQDNNLTLNNVSINNVEGDGLDLYAKGGNQPGVSNNVIINHSKIGPVGYHAIVPEYVNGFTFENSSITTGNIDAEVDFNCQSNPSDCGTLTNPNVGIVNFTIQNSTFPFGLQILDGASCMPVGNWSVLNNDFGAGGFVLEMNTTYSLTLAELKACGQYSGLKISGNKSTATAQHPCCGANSPYILIQGWKNVDISNNSFNTLTTGALIELWSVSNIGIKNNVFAGAAGVWDNSQPADWPPMAAPTQCGNSWGVSQKDAVC